MGFLLIGLVGALVLFFLQFFGDHGHHDFGHDVVGDDHAGGPSPLSLRTVSIFLMLFGFAGALGQYYRLTPAASSLIGLGSGFVAAAIAYGFYLLLYRQQASSTISFSQLASLPAQVTTAIPEDGAGEIAVVLNGQRHDVLARSRLGAIPVGTTVRIIRDLGASVLVDKIELGKIG